jgi:hypothetical protein
MRASTNWRIVAVALVAALVPIGVSLAAVYYPATEDETATPIEVSTYRTFFKDTGEAWRGALNAIATPLATSTKDFRAPLELSTTDALGEELIATFLTLQSENKIGTEEAKQSYIEAMKRNVTVINPNDTYTLASIRTDPKMTTDQYAETFGVIIDRANSIREYELALFAGAVHVKDTNGTPALQSAARVYRTIERDLAGTSVPTGLADAHLRLLKSTAFLAQSVELMGDWSGDPIDAMSYTDAFVRAERQNKVAFDNLFATIVKLNKQI